MTRPQLLAALTLAAVASALAFEAGVGVGFGLGDVHGAANACGQMRHAVRVGHLPWIWLTGTICAFPPGTEP